MASEKKIEQVKKLTEKLKEADSLVLVNYKGLTHQQLVDLRKRLKETGSSLMVTKNTLLERAIKASSFQLLTSSFQLTGPTATLFIYDDPIPSLRALAQFLNEFGLPEIKIGILEGEVTSEERVLRLATLPSKEVLTAQVVSSLKAPTQRLALSLAWDLQKLNLILKALKEKQESKN